MKQIFVWLALALTATANYAAQQVPWDTANAYGMTVGVPQGDFLRGVGNNLGSSGAGVGKASDSQTSTTLSGITGGVPQGD